MKVLFAGTPAFAVPTLQALHESQHKLVGVLTQPDRPAGRGRQLKPSAVKCSAQGLNVALYQPASLKHTESFGLIRALGPDVIVVVAYGLLFPSEILQSPQYGCINLHPSLLPRWRGAAPIQRAIWAGDAMTGVTIMQMGQGLDDGDVLVQQQTPIQPSETADKLHDRLAELGSQTMLSALAGLADGRIHPTPQDPNQATYAHKLHKAEAQIDWQASADTLERMIRALNPKPVAFSYFNQQELRIWQAHIVAGRANAAPGVIECIDDDRVIVATGQGRLALTEVQRSGAKRLSANDWVNGASVQAGHRFQ